MELLIPAAMGLEAVVKRELSRLGYEDTKAINGKIILSGDWIDIAKLNVNLRTGERVLIKLKEGKAETFDELFELVSSIPWEEYLSSDSIILLDGKSVKSKLVAVKAMGGVAKKAIVKRLLTHLHTQKKKIEETGARSVIGVSLFQDIATITLNTSGDGLHKRGYRKLAYTAPLKETMAAALLDLSLYNPDKSFADVFCGSGTLPIEAAMRALKIAPGIQRTFDYCSWKCAPKGIDKQAKEEAKEKETRDRKIKIYGCDISKEAISIAQYHARQAGVEKSICLEVKDMRSFHNDEPYGVIVSNPPYGERLNNEKEIQVLYKDLGRMYQSLPDWSLFALTSYSSFERWFGKRADKNRKLYNANLECYYYSFLGAKPPKS